MARRKPIIRYGISLGIDTTDMARGAREANRVTRRLNRDIGSVDRATREYKHAQMQLRNEFRQGLITQKQYLTGIRKERERRDKATGALARYRAQQRAKAHADKIEQQNIMRTERQQRALNAQRQRELQIMAAQRAKHAQAMGGMGAGGLSAMGFGGTAAGGARFAGNAVAEGMSGSHMVALGIGAVGMMSMARFTKNNIDQYASLEAKLTDLKVLFGEIKGKKLAEEFRQLAASTALTTTQLVTNAKTWASYGLSADGIVERMRRLGEVAGGNTEKFQALTVAFAQVNAQGKLMGQEKNQLINAGFSLGEVAKVAGIEMKDFAKAMEDGKISAEHVNQALVNMTEEGGLFAGLLEEKSKTLEGQATIVASAWEEASVSMGKSASWMQSWYNKMSKSLADYLKHHSEWAASTREDGPAGGTSQEKFNISGTTGGKWGGSYVMDGALRSGLGSTLTVGTDQNSMFGDRDSMTLMGRMFADTQYGGGMFGRGAMATFQDTNWEQRALASGLDPTLRFGDRDAAIALQQRREWEHAEKVKRQERAKADAMEAKERAKEQSSTYAKQKYKWMYQSDTSRGGFNQYSMNKDLHDVNELARLGKISYQQQRDLMQLIRMDYQTRANVDRKKEQERIAEKNKSRVQGFMQFDKYENQGLTPEAQALLKKRDKDLEAVGKMRAGTRPNALMNNNEYSMIADRRQKTEDARRAIKIAERQEREQRQIRMNTNTQITLMSQQNQFLENNIGSVD